VSTATRLFAGFALIAATSPAVLPAQDSAATSARTAVAQLRDAIRTGDWQQVSVFLPASGPWTDVVHRMVTSRDTSVYSAWRRDSELLLDSLQIAVLNPDQVAASGPFRVGGAVGFWGAILRLRASHWQLECTSEQLGGQRVWHAPYCLARRP
jgi:hypothetical protein